MSPGLALARVTRRASRLVNARASGPASSARWFSSLGDRDAPPLAYELIEPPESVSPSEAASAPLAIVLHGLMGSGRNWRTFTRALSRRVADEGVPWRFALVDNLWHGPTERRYGMWLSFTGEDLMLSPSTDEYDKVPWVLEHHQ